MHLRWRNALGLHSFLESVSTGHDYQICAAKCGASDKRQWLPDLDSVSAYDSWNLPCYRLDQERSRRQVWVRCKNQLRLAHREVQRVNDELRLSTTEAAEEKWRIRCRKFMFTWFIIESQKKTRPATLHTYLHQRSSSLPSSELHSADVGQLRKKANNHPIEGPF